MKKSMKWLGLTALSLTLAACNQPVEEEMVENVNEQKGPILDDPYLWLENVEGEEALAFVEGLNEDSLAILENEPGFADYQKRAEDILSAKDLSLIHI